MEPEAVPPPIADGGPVGGTEGGPRTVKRFKHLKRSFVEVVADSPSFVEEVPVQLENANWFEEDIVVDSDNEEEPNEREDGIPVVRFSKKVREDLIKLWRNTLLVKFLGKPVAFTFFQQRLLQLWNLTGKVDFIDETSQAEGATEQCRWKKFMHAPTPIAKHGAWMIVNRKSKGLERGSAKSTGTTKGVTKQSSTYPSNGTKAEHKSTRTRDTVGGGHLAGNSTIQVSTSTKSTGKGKQVDTTPVSNTFAYLQDLENLQETPVLLDEDTVPRGAPKPRNHRKNNKGKKQTIVTLGTSSSLTGLFSKGSSNSNQIFVFGNTTGAPPNPSAGGVVSLGVGEAAEARPVSAGELADGQYWWSHVDCG
nr:LINE-type retrotransposon LIb DNA [Ipomoea batatas]